MTRICIVGNSHVAAMKLGWDQIKADHAGVDVTFFGVPGRQLRDMLVDKDAGTLTPASDKNKRFFHQLSGGLDTIVTASYDHFVVVGLELSIFRWLQMYKQIRHLPFKLDIGTPQVMSAEVFETARRAVFTDTSGHDVFWGLHNAGATSVFICPQPLPAPAVAQLDGFWALLADGEDLALVAQSYREDVTRGFPDAASVIWQPDATLDGVLTTKATYSQGSRRLNLEKSHGDDDFQHMNAAYGALILETVMAATAAISAKE